MCPNQSGRTPIGLLFSLNANMFQGFCRGHLSSKAQGNHVEIVREKKSVLLKTMVGHIGIKTHHMEHAATVKQGAIFSPQMTV